MYDITCCIYVLGGKICFSLLNFLLAILMISFLFGVTQIPPERKCIAPRLVPCQIRQRTTMDKWEIILHKDRLVNKAATQHFHKYAVCTSKVSNNTKR